MHAANVNWVCPLNSDFEILFILCIWTMKCLVNPTDQFRWLFKHVATYTYTHTMKWINLSWQIEDYMNIP